MLAFVFSWTTIVFAWSSKALPRGEYVNLAYSIILLCSEGNVSSPVKYSYLLILPDDRADIFAASLLVSYCIFIDLYSDQQLLWFYYVFIQKDLWINRLSADKVVSLTEKEYDSTMHFF